MSLAEEIARQLPGTPVRLVEGQVVVSGGVARVNIGGNTPQVSWPAGYTPANGDAVLVALYGMGAAVLQKKIPGAAPPTPGPPPAIPPPAPPAPPPAPAATVDIASFAAIETRSWRSGRWRFESADVIQGVVPGNAAANSGAWFYGSGPKSLAGTVVQSGQLWLHGFGATVPTPTIHLYRHTSLTRPAGDVTRVQGPFDVVRGFDEAGWVDLPVAYVQALVDSGGGLGITGTPGAIIRGLTRAGQSGALRIGYIR